MVMAEAARALTMDAALDEPNVQGYKQTDVGAIPEDWRVAKIGDVAKLINGRGFKPFEWKTRGLPIIRIQNLNGSEEFNYFDGSYDRKLEVSPGQLLFAWSGSRGTSFGPHVWNGPFGLLNYHTWKVNISDDSLDPSFFFHALKSLTEYIEGWAHGASALVHVQKWQMEGFQLPLPPTNAEQRAIAEALDEADGFIESLKRYITKKRLVKQGVMQELLSGKTRLPGFSARWVEKTFSEVFDFHPTATNSRSDLHQNGDTYYIHYGDIHTRFHSHLDFKAKQPPRIRRAKCRNAAFLKNGDWIMADASEDFDGVGKSIEVVGLGEDDQAVSGLHTFLLREKESTFAPGFKGHLGNLKSLHEQYLRVMTGMKVFGVSKTALKDLILNIPELDEQTKIVEILSDMDAEIEALEGKLVKADEIKQGMMQELLTGRVRLI